MGETLAPIWSQSPWSRAALALDQAGLDLDQAGLDLDQAGLDQEEQ